MEHIERMETELKELEEKISKAVDFYYKELGEPNFLDKHQCVALGKQITHMNLYKSDLKGRISYDNEKESVE